LWVSLPVMIGTFVQFAVTITDSAFMNQVSAIDFNAAGNAGMIYITLYMLAMGIGNGLQVIVARREGENNFIDAGKNFNNAYFVLIVFSLLLCALIYLASQFMIPHIVKDELTGEKMQDYLDWRTWGIIFAATNQGYHGFYSGIARTKIIMYTSLITAIGNIALDYGLIFGNFGMPKMGIEGAAFASSLSELAAFIFSIIYANYDKHLKKYSLFKNFSIDKKLIKNLLVISWPLMIQGMVSVGVWTIFFFFIEKMGTDNLEISHIIRNFYFLALIPVLGMGIATRTFVSTLMAQNKQNEVIPTVFKIIFISVTITFLFVHPNLFYPYEVIEVLSPNKSIYAEAIFTLRIVTGAMLVMAVSMPLINLISGAGDTKTAFRIELISIAIYLSMAYLLTVVWPQNITIVWCLEFVYFGVMGLAAIFYIRRGKWRTIKI
jgi:putative MATE family efflux protein